jgi:hypothetical protein
MKTTRITSDNLLNSIRPVNILVYPSLKNVFGLPKITVFFRCSRKNKADALNLTWAHIMPSLLKNIY